MSKANRCDICGGFFCRTDNPDIFNRLIALKLDYKNGFNVNDGKHSDVCPDCAKAIENLIENIKNAKIVKEEKEMATKKEEKEEPKQVHLCDTCDHRYGYENGGDRCGARGDIFIHECIPVCGRYKKAWFYNKKEKEND